MMNILYTFIILLLIIISISVIIKLFSKFNIDKNKKSGLYKYDVLTPIKGNAKNMNYCLSGCVRGSCNRRNKDKNSCKYDFQCSYCQDKNTNMFYINYDDMAKKEILPIYEEKKLDSNETTYINKEIIKNNKYIDKINERIKIINS
jgi:hypothetical protein